MESRRLYAEDARITAMRAALIRKAEENPTSIDCKAISALSTFLNRVIGAWRRPGCSVGIVEKGNPLRPVRLVPLRSIFTVQTCLFPSSVVYKSTSSPRTNGHASVKRARDALREVELANDLVKQLQPYLRAQYQSARQKVNALRLRTRFTSLPKNVLSEVLVLATRPRYVSSRTVLDVDEEMQSIKQARTLSHVCRRFRSIILSKTHI